MAEQVKKEPSKFLYRPHVVRVDEQGKATQIVYQKRGKWWIPLLIIVGLIVFSCFFIEIPNRIRFDQIGEILSQLFVPSKYSLKTYDAWWAYLWYSCKRIYTTVEMVFLATVVGALLAVPCYLLAARNVTANKPINIIVRVIVNILRTIPTFVLAIIGAIFFGYNETAGVFALAVFTFGIIFKLMYEHIETLDMNPFEVAMSNGGGRLAAYSTSLHPDAYPMFLSYFIYTFEINIRASVVLGFVGVGGIGQLLSDAIDSTQYDRVGAILVPLLAVVWILQALSSYLRRKLQ